MSAADNLWNRLAMGARLGFVLGVGLFSAGALSVIAVEVLLDASQRPDLALRVYRPVDDEWSERLKIGTVQVAFIQTRPPPEWLPCDGRTLKAGEYPELASALKVDTAGKDLLRLPDFRGMWIIELGIGSGIMGEVRVGFDEAVESLPELARRDLMWYIKAR